MTTIPPRPDDALDWVAARITKWSADPTAVGLSAEDLAALQLDLDAANAAQAAKVATKAASLSATASFKDKYMTRRDRAGVQVATIRAFARSSADPQSVYSLADIPAPATPGESPAPAQPRDFRVTLLQNGALSFTFKCPNPVGATGVTYKVERQDASQAPFTFLVNAKDKRFEDTTFPNTSALIFYRVTAQTATKDGLPAEFTVRYGAGNQQASIVTQGDGAQREAS